MATYTITDINNALDDANVVACRKAIEEKKNEIAAYERQITRMNEQISQVTTRKSVVEAKKATADADLVSLETQLKIDMANFLGA